jgi:membrane protein implicated in regulation of membrane protease activity
MWLVLGLLLVFAELHHMAFFALFAAAGCFAAALTALLAPSAVGLQVIVAVAVAVTGVIGIRPFVSRVFHTRRGGHVSRGVHGGIVGQEALTLDSVGDAHHPGHVRLGGERWLAVSGGGHPIDDGVPVVVTSVRGTTLVVWPLDAAGGVVPPLPQQPQQLDQAPDGADRRQEQ